jgi:hypothetical protein
VVGRRYTIRRLKLRRRRRDGIKVGRVGWLLIRSWILGRRGHGTWIIRTLRMGEDARSSVATSREVPARDEPSNLRGREVGDIAASRGWGLVVSGRRRRRGWGKGWGIVWHGALWNGWDWKAGIVCVRARMWHVISLRRGPVRIVDKSRVLVRGVRINLGSSSCAQQFHNRMV